MSDDQAFLQAIAVYQLFADHLFREQHRAKTTGRSPQPWYEAACDLHRIARDDPASYREQIAEMLDQIEAVAPSAVIPVSRRVHVDETAGVIIIDGKRYSTTSERAARWIGKLVDAGGDWVSAASDLPDDLRRPDKYRCYLPDDVLAIVETVDGKGSRIVLPD